MIGASAARRHPAYWAFVVHRLSGVGLAVFLPFHFYVLALALRADAALDDFLRWTESPLVKLSETLLVVLLSAHLAGGVRLLAVEFKGWRDETATAVAIGAGFALTTGLAFLMVAF